MRKKANHIHPLHGLVLATLLLIFLSSATAAGVDPAAAAKPADAAAAAKPADAAAAAKPADPAINEAAGAAGGTSAGQPGPGASPEHEIPSDPAQIDDWFARIIKPVKERQGLEPDLVNAEAKMEVIKVRTDGTGKFKTIMEAVNAVEAKGNDNRVIIDIGPGTYHEKIMVSRYRPYVTFYGDPQDKPTLIFDDNTDKAQAMDTATLTVEGDYFVGVNLNIVNSSPRPSYSNGEESAIALRVSGNWTAFYDCRFMAIKNTLLDDEGRHLYKDCYIEGATEFILGDGRSIFLKTEIHVLPNDPVSIIAAQARKNEDPRAGGFVFAHCDVDGKAGKGLLGSTYMAGSRVIYAYTAMSEVVNGKGWSDDFKTDYEKTAFFGEYKNTGPGADLSGRVKLPCVKTMTEELAKSYLTLDFIDAAEWLLPPPETSKMPL